jgi:translation initiation factor 5A
VPYLSHVVIKGRPCKIIETKHEDDEIHLVAIDIFNGKKYQDVAPPSYNMDVPAVTRTEYQFLYIEDGTLHLLGMNHNDAVKEDVYVPDNEIGEKIRIYDQDGTEIGQESYVCCKKPFSDCLQWSPSFRLWG